MTGMCHPTPGLYTSHAWTKDDDGVICWHCGVTSTDPHDIYNARIWELAGKAFNEAFKENFANCKANYTVKWTKT